MQKGSQIIQSSQFNIVHERKQDHFQSMANVPMTETMTYMLSKDEGSDMELTLQQATAF